MGQQTSPTLDPGSRVPPDGARASPQAGPPIAKSTPLHSKRWTLWPTRAFSSHPAPTSAGAGVPTSASFLRVPHRTYLGQLLHCSTVEGVGVCLRWGKDGARSNDT